MGCMWVGGGVWVVEGVDVGVFVGVWGGGDVCEGVEDVGVFVFVVLVLVGEGCGILGCVWVWRVWGV